VGRSGGILLVLAALSACRSEVPTPAPSLPVEVSSELRVPPQELTVAPEQEDECARRIAELMKESNFAGAPEMERYRAEILARARSVPVVFLSTPKAPSDASTKAREYRRQLRESGDPGQTIFEIIKATSGLRELRRQVFLSDGYLYAESPQLALRLSQVLRLEHLFDEHTLTIERGDRELTVTRDEGSYWLPSTEPIQTKGPHHGGPASLLLFDRVRGPDTPRPAPLHFDLSSLQKSVGFSTATVKHMGPGGIVLALSTYGLPSEAIVQIEGTELRFSCETPGEVPLEHLQGARKLWLSDQELIDPVLAAAHEMIRRRLPFDEPKTEEGQQDGLLRIHFRKAYRSYRRTYEFNGDDYYVFDGYGHPRLPQVCIDFITDAFDWGTGGHWPDRGEKPERVQGALNFESLGIENPRSVENLANFATETPEWFDMLWLEKTEHVKFLHREKFFAALARDAHRYRRGDVVFIYGLRDDGKFHFHSFLIDQKDPVTGIPMVVLANAGPPQARSWEGEMASAPLRKIVARMRVRRDILELAKRQRQENPGLPLTPPPRPQSEEEAPAQDPKPPG
jgi:hypothetical protein